MATPKQVITRAIATQPIVPLVAPTYFAPQTTIPQPNLVPDVGPIPLFQQPKTAKKIKPVHLLMIAATIYLYLTL